MKAQTKAKHKLLSWLTPTMPSTYLIVRLPSKYSTAVPLHLYHSHQYIQGNTLIYTLMVPQYYHKWELLRNYSAHLLPLIHHVNHVIDQVWYANDATATGKMTNLRTWWDKLVSLGPAYGYHANASKTCLVAKQSHHAATLSAFHDTQIIITAEGKPHLGAALGTFTFVQHYVKRKVGGWAQELNQLASIAANNSHAAYAAFTHGLSSKWTFLARTISNIRHLMQPLEDIIQSKLIPNLTGRCAPSDTILFSLPLEA